MLTMLTDWARSHAYDLLRTIAKIFAGLGISPNTLTVVGFGGMCGVAVLLALGYEALGGVLIIAVGIFDALDGTLARTTGRATKFGAFLDSTLDRWAEGALFFAIIYRAAQRQDHITIYLATLALIGSLLVSYTRARAEGLNVSVKEGWFTRLERFIVLIAGLLLTAFFGPLALTLALAILALFSNITALQRVLAARRALES